MCYTYFDGIAPSTRMLPFGKELDRLTFLYSPGRTSDGNPTELQIITEGHPYSNILKLETLLQQRKSD